MIRQFAPLRLKRPIRASSIRKLMAGVTIGVLATGLTVVAFLKHPVTPPAPTAQACNVAFSKLQAVHLQGYARFYDCTKMKSAAIGQPRFAPSACQAIRREADLVLSNATADLLNCYRTVALVGEATHDPTVHTSQQLAMSLLTQNAPPTDRPSEDQTNIGSRANLGAAEPVPVTPVRQAARAVRTASHSIDKKTHETLAKMVRRSESSAVINAASSAIRAESYSLIALDGHWPPPVTHKTKLAPLNTLQIADEISGTTVTPGLIAFDNPAPQISWAPQSNDDGEIHLRPNVVSDAQDGRLASDDAAIALHPRIVGFMDQTEASEGPEATQVRGDATSSDTKHGKALSPAPGSNVGTIVTPLTSSDVRPGASRSNFLTPEKTLYSKNIVVDSMGWWKRLHSEHASGASLDASVVATLDPVAFSDGQRSIDQRTESSVGTSLADVQIKAMRLLEFGYSALPLAPTLLTARPVMSRL